MSNNHKATLKKNRTAREREKEREREEANQKQHDKDTHIGQCVHPEYSQILKTPNTFFFHKPYHCGAFTTLQLMTNTNHTLILQCCNLRQTHL